MFSNVSLVVQVLSVIIVITTILTLVVAVFSYVAFKVQQRRRPTVPDEVPDFFQRFGPDRLAGLSVGPGAIEEAGGARRPPL